MIKNILFDMGNVLIHFDRKAFLDRLDVSEEDKQLLMREVFLSVEWVQMDRGTLCEETAEPLMCQRLPAHLHGAVHSLVSLWDEPMLPITGMAELVPILAAMGFGAVNAYALMTFCLLYTPCTATLATIKRESGSWAWTGQAVAFQLAVAWVVTFVVYHVGNLLF